MQGFRTKSLEFTREDAIMTGMRDARCLCNDPSYDDTGRTYSLVTYLSKNYNMAGKKWGVSIVFFDTIEEKIEFDNSGVNHYLFKLSQCDKANAMQICLN